MSIRKLNEVLVLFNQALESGDVETDPKTAEDYARGLPSDRSSKLLDQLNQLARAPESLALDEIGSEANRWFSEHGEVAAWLNSLIASIESVVQSQNEGAHGADADPPRDSNGTLLSEGDSVLVIKDLKVKGGSSDLKRGTLIKKIHLIGDPENIECRVDGSTLVLKTMFLRKS